MSMITATNLSVSIKGAQLLDGIDLHVERGEWLSIIGPNGAGKSTLLRALAGVVPCDGAVTIDGAPLAGYSPRSLARKIAWVPQTPTIPPGMRVVDYVLLGRTPHLHPLAAESSTDRELVAQVLDDLDLTGLADRAVESLSGGERQRTVIARALAQEAPIMLLDEPTTALDLGHQQDALDLLTGLRMARDRTIISTMHDLTLAGAYADRLMLLAEGRVVDSGAAAKVLTVDNIATHYRAEVTISHVGDSVLVAPRLRGANSTPEEANDAN